MSKKQVQGMKGKKVQGINELYSKDPIAADRTLWGRESNPVSRRGFLKEEWAHCHEHCPWA